MTKTMSIRMDQDNYEFLAAIAKEEQSDLSKAVRELVTRGRILLAIDNYRRGEASPGRKQISWDRVPRPSFAWAGEEDFGSVFSSVKVEMLGFPP